MRIMKYVLVVGDGISDRPLKELGGKTPLEAAKTPNMDFLASNGTCGKFVSSNEKYAVGTDTAHFLIFGYALEKNYTGRGPIEAAAMGLQMGENDIAVRCNLVNLKDGKMNDYSAAHVTTAEAKKLMQELNEKLGNEEIEFHPGVAYRHIMMLKGNHSGEVETDAPHDIMEEEIEAHMPKGSGEEGEKTAHVLEKLMKDSWEILENHEVNKKRRDNGVLTANSIWLWSLGKKPELETLHKRFGKSGAIITAVDVLKGIGKLMGLEYINVQGATGFLDTNYEGKAQAALDALERHDFVIVHIEAPDEAGHMGNAEEKIKAIERIDRIIIGRLLERLEWDYRIAITGDHGTSVELKTHIPDPVPFAVYTRRDKKDRTIKFCEKNAKDVTLHNMFLEMLFKK